MTCLKFTASFEMQTEQNVQGHFPRHIRPIKYIRSGSDSEIVCLADMFSCEMKVDAE